MRTIRLALAALTMMVVAGCQTTSSPPLAPAGGMFTTNMAVGGSSVPPLGFNDFCRRHPADCDEATATPASVRLDARKWQELNEINRHVNRTITYVSDQEKYGTLDHWAYPTTHGDCEDFALLKRKLLIERGWPPSSLVIGVGHSRRWGVHAMLLVVTDQGDLALDNNTNAILPWDQTDMRWAIRQSQQSARLWKQVL